ncbi:MAG: HEAT repeat domain-containing protein, partial [Calditrichaeota bacterium]
DRGKDLEEVKADYQERFDVPADWFTGAFDDSVKAADSLLNYSLDIYIQDIRQMTPQSSVIIFDQCFNGAYIHSQYVAGEYLFGEGNTIAAIANSVNVIQDLWSVEFLGMLDAGVRIGEWYKLRNYLESHVLGDPTFRFLPSDIGYPRELFKNPNVTEKTLRQYVNHNHPLIRAYALYRLFQLKDLDVEDELITAYQQDESFNVRLEALKCLASLRTSSFEEILKGAIADPYELIRRFSVKWMGDLGRYDYLPYLVDNLFKDPAKRVNSNSWDAITKIGSDSARALALQMYSGQFSLSRRDDLMERLRSKVSSDSNWLYQDLMGKIMDDTLSGKKRYSAIRTFRYYRFREAVPFLLNYVQDDSQPEFLRETAIEALGWYTFSLHRNRIKEVCESIIKNKKNSAQLVNEARKTVKRIEAGANAPVTP